jgi:regulator of protease activity HflC (stomatin/prohibitin superfamily)
MKTNKTITIQPNEFGILYIDNNISKVLNSGVYKINKFFVNNQKIETYKITSPIKGELFDIIEFGNDEIKRHFSRFEASHYEYLILLINDRTKDILSSQNKVMYHNSVGIISTKSYNIKDSSELPQIDANYLLSSFGTSANVATYEVAEGHTGLLFIDGSLSKKLNSGRYYFFRDNKIIKLEQYSIKKQIIEVTGQEVLTKNKVTIRINLVGTWQINNLDRVYDTYQNSPHTFIYQELQLRLREIIGSMTLNEILENKNQINDYLNDYTLYDTVNNGIELRKIGIKDVILPGEIRELMNKVVEAEKKAEANVIKRREETAATRSLLNTAKLMEDNPTLLRLKELESLEKVVEKIGTLNVYGGIDSLMSETIRLTKKE